MLRLIGLTLFIVAEIVYNRFCPAFEVVVMQPAVGLTNASIMYFTATYLSLIIICWEGYKKEYSKIFKIIFIVYASFFMLQIISELPSYGMPYEVYITNVSNSMINKVTHMFLFIILGAVISVFWYKYFNKNRLCQRKASKT
jgi:hypothetical protein